MKPRLAAGALLLALGAAPSLARSGSNAPLDFSYRVQGDGRIAPLVFSDGNDIYIQPDREQLGELRVLDAPFVQEGPYLVVKGLRERFTLSWRGAVTTVSHAAAATAAAQPSPAAFAPHAAARCRPGVEVAETRYPVVFLPRSTRLNAAFVERLPAIVAEAKTADAVTVVGRPDVSDVQFAQRRAIKVRTALVAQGVPEGLIRIEARSAPEHGSELVVSRRRETSCPAAQSEALTATASGRPDSAPHLDPAVAAALAGDPQLASPVSDEDRRKTIQQLTALVQAGKISESMGAHLILAANRAAPAEAAMPAALMSGAVRPALPAAEAQPNAPGAATLTFVPNSSVRRVLRAYLRDRGIDLDWQVQGDLIVEEFAAIPGGDMKEVIERALRRLGLKGTLVAGRLLIVESRS